MIPPSSLALLAIALSFAVPGFAGEAKWERILFVGNSITRHGPSAKIGWSGDWGMAASAAEKDYVHVLVDRIAKSRGKEPQFRVVNLAQYERSPEGIDLAATLKEELAFGADTIVVALGENVPALKSAEAEEKFTADMVRLLKVVKGDGDPAIFVRSGFWADPKKDSALKNACAQVGGVYVDISALGKDEGNYGRAEREFSHDGVARHPGDKGMSEIAAAIFAAMEGAGK